MVNSGSLDSDGSRNGKNRWTPAAEATSSPESSDSPNTSTNSDQELKRTPSKSDIISNTSTDSSLRNVFDSNEDKTSVCCSLPLDVAQGVLSSESPPSDQKIKQTRKLLCLYCDRSFVSSKLRQKHVERVHSSKPIGRVSSRRQNQLCTTPCVHCDKLNTSEHTLNDLFRHLASEHSAKYFACVLCEERFLTPLHLSDHNAVKHGVEEKTTIKRRSPVTPKIEEVAVDSEEKVTRSKLRNKAEGRLDVEDNTKRVDNKSKRTKFKKIAVKTSKIALKRSKRLQAQSKELDNQKKKRERKSSNANKPEPSTSTNLPEKSKSTCINPYPEFDNFYRVKKITDHSIDNLKISSLTFDDVFDKAFFNRIKCNIEENLLHHIDGKLFKNEESESRISNFEKISSLPQELQSSSAENYGCDLSLNAVTPVASLSLNSQFGEDFESQIEYGSKPSKKKAQSKNDEVHYKYFTRRKYQASILQQKENRDLSKLDMWTQMVVKQRQEKLLNDQKSPKEILEYTSGFEYKNKLRREELNRILDRRGPFEDLKEEASKKAALDKLNSSSDTDVSEEVFTDVREVLNDILNKVFETIKEEECPEESASKEVDQREIPAYLDLRRRDSSTLEEIDKSDRIALICSSQETENFELPTNKAREKNELIELTGEWARSRMYICAACGAKFANIKYLLEHKSLYHQNVWVQHYEFVGNQSELYRHLSIPGLGKVGVVEETVQSKQWKRSNARLCTKCGKKCNSLGELHRHVLECGGDWTWMLARKKCKYRPFGAKSRRKRRGLVRRIIRKQKTEQTSEKKKYKKNITGPRQKPSDAETIQRMLANLPAKRSRRSLISLRDVVFKSRKNNSAQTPLPVVKCGKTVCNKPNNVALHLPRSNKSQRSLNKVLSSRILDLNSSLIVKRKIKAIRGNKPPQLNQKPQPPKPEEDSNKEKEDSDLEALPSNQKKKPKKIVSESDKGEKSFLRTRQKSSRRILTSRLNIKSFFPIKKRNIKQLRQSANTAEIIEDSNNEKKENKKDSKSQIENQEHSKQNKKGGLKGLVRALSLRKKPVNDEPEPEINTEPVNTEDNIDISPPKRKVGRPKLKKTPEPETKPEEAESPKPEEALSNKRKLQRGFRNLVNKVKKLKTDKPAPIVTKPEKVSFLEKKDVPSEKTCATPAKAKENLREKEDLVLTVDDLSTPKEDTPIPETIFNFSNDEEKALQAKGDLNFDSKETKQTDLLEPLPKETSGLDHSNPVTIDTSIKPKNVPLVSPNLKGKIRKPNRGLNDCIAMLTSKLTSSKEDKVSSSLESLFSNSSAIESSVKPQKTECILKIPNFKASKSPVFDEEAALDLSKKSVSTPNLFYSTESTISKVIEGVIEHKCKEVLNEKLGTTSWSSVDDIIQHVVNSSGVFRKPNKKLTFAGRTNVDDTIDFVINSSNDWFEKQDTYVEPKKDKKLRKRKNSDDNLIKDIIFGKDKLLIAPSRNSSQNELPVITKIRESNLSKENLELKAKILENLPDKITIEEWKDGTKNLPNKILEDPTNALEESDINTIESEKISLPEQITKTVEENETIDDLLESQTSTKIWNPEVSQANTPLIENICLEKIEDESLKPENLSDKESNEDHASVNQENKDQVLEPEEIISQIVEQEKKTRTKGRSKKIKPKTKSPTDEEETKITDNTKVVEQEPKLSICPDSDDKIEKSSRTVSNGNLKHEPSSIRVKENGNAITPPLEGMLNSVSCSSDVDGKSLPVNEGENKGVVREAICSDSEDELPLAVIAKSEDHKTVEMAKGRVDESEHDKNLEDKLSNILNELGQIEDEPSVLDSEPSVDNNINNSIVQKESDIIKRSPVTKRAGRKGKKNNKVIDDTRANKTFTLEESERVTIPESPTKIITSSSLPDQTEAENQDPLPTNHTNQTSPSIESIINLEIAKIDKPVRKKKKKKNHKSIDPKPLSEKEMADKVVEYSDFQAGLFKDAQRNMTVQLLNEPHVENKIIQEQLEEFDQTNKSSSTPKRKIKSNKGVRGKDSVTPDQEESKVNTEQLNIGSDLQEELKEFVETNKSSPRPKRKIKSNKGVRGKDSVTPDQEKPEVNTEQLNIESDSQEELEKFVETNKSSPVNSPKPKRKIKSNKGVRGENSVTPNQEKPEVNTEQLNIESDWQEELEEFGKTNKSSPVNSPKPKRKIKSNKGVRGENSVTPDQEKSEVNSEQLNIESDSQEELEEFVETNKSSPRPKRKIKSNKGVRGENSVTPDQEKPEVNTEQLNIESDWQEELEEFVETNKSSPRPKQKIKSNRGVRGKNSVIPDQDQEKPEVNIGQLNVESDSSEQEINVTKDDCKPDETSSNVSPNGSIKTDETTIEADVNKPGKLVIATQRTRRKSKSSKKIEKVDNDLFKDFSLVINKKTKRIPPTSIVDDSVCEDILDASINFSNKEPVQLELNDSVEEMDMEIEDIPIRINIIERENEQSSMVFKPSEDSGGIDDIRPTSPAYATTRKSPRKKSLEDADIVSKVVIDDNTKSSRRGQKAKQSLEENREKILEVVSLETSNESTETSFIESKDVDSSVGVETTTEEKDKLKIENIESLESIEIGDKNIINNNEVEASNEDIQETLPVNQKKGRPRKTVKLSKEVPLEAIESKTVLAEESCKEGLYYSNLTLSNSDCKYSIPQDVNTGTDVDMVEQMSKQSKKEFKLKEDIENIVLKGTETSSDYLENKDYVIKENITNNTCKDNLLESHILGWESRFVKRFISRKNSKRNKKAKKLVSLGKTLLPKTSNEHRTKYVFDEKRRSKDLSKKSGKDKRAKMYKKCGRLRNRNMSQIPDTVLLNCSVSETQNTIYENKSSLPSSHVELILEEQKLEPPESNNTSTGLECESVSIDKDKELFNSSLELEPEEKDTTGFGSSSEIQGTNLRRSGRNKQSNILSDKSSSLTDSLGPSTDFTFGETSSLTVSNIGLFPSSDNDDNVKVPETISVLKSTDTSESNVDDKVGSRSRRAKANLNYNEDVLIEKLIETNSIPEKTGTNQLEESNKKEINLKNRSKRNDKQNKGQEASDTTSVSSPSMNEIITQKHDVQDQSLEEIEDQRVNAEDSYIPVSSVKPISPKSVVIQNDVKIDSLETTLNKKLPKPKRKNLLDIDTANILEYESSTDTRRSPRKKKTLLDTKPSVLSAKECQKNIFNNLAECETQSSQDSKRKDCFNTEVSVSESKCDTNAQTSIVSLVSSEDNLDDFSVNLISAKSLSNCVKTDHLGSPNDVVDGPKKEDSNLQQTNKKVQSNWPESIFKTPPQTEEQDEEYGKFESKKFNFNSILKLNTNLLKEEMVNPIVCLPNVLDLVDKSLPENLLANSQTKSLLPSNINITGLKSVLEQIKKPHGKEKPLFSNIEPLTEIITSSEMDIAPVLDEIEKSLESDDIYDFTEEESFTDIKTRPKSQKNKKVNSKVLRKKLIKKNMSELKEEPVVARRSSDRHAKIKALESIHEKALIELKDSDIKSTINSRPKSLSKDEDDDLPMGGKENETYQEFDQNCSFEGQIKEDLSDIIKPSKEVIIDDSFSPIKKKTPKTPGDLPEATSTESQELRRSRRDSRKISSYNENDLIDPLIDALENTRKATRKDKSSGKKEIEKPKLNSEQLFDLLKNSTYEGDQVDFLGKPESTIGAEEFNYNGEVDVSSAVPQKSSDPDKIYEFTDESLDNTKQIKEELFNKSKKKSQDKRPSVNGCKESSISFISNNSLDSTTKPDDNTKKPNYCEICKKSFIRLENLIKHKTTLTHISKLSELEAKEAEEKSKLNTIESPPPNEINLTMILESGRPNVEIKNVPTPLINNHSLKLVDIISDVLNKPVLESYSSNKTDFSEMNGEVRHYISAAERKSFDSDNLLVDSYRESPISKTTILEKQINLLENIIGNNLEGELESKTPKASDNFIDISSCSNTSNVDNNSCASNSSTFNTTTQNRVGLETDFLKPNQYEEISEDSATARVYEDPKLRKTLNRDEELFLECCSLLKSGSEVSNSTYSKQPKNQLNQYKKYDQPEENKKLVQTAEEAHEYSDNSRTPTPLGDTYDDDASNSNTISSNWHLKSEKALNQNRSFSFEEVLHKEENTSAVAISFGEMLSQGLKNQFGDAPKCSRDSEATKRDIVSKNFVPGEPNHDTDGPNLENKTFMTKGARKVFEGLKVSIPTEELNLDVLNNQFNHKSVSKDSSYSTEPVSPAKLRPTRKSKPVKKSQVGSNLLFKVNKKKNPQPSQVVSKTKQDVYNFEDTQDNCDLFSRTEFDGKKDFTKIVEDIESQSYTDSIGADAQSASSVSSFTAESVKKQEEVAENITKKKYMIMGKIFKNAAKSKMNEIDQETRSIPEIPEMDNFELVENYVRDCQRIKSPIPPIVPGDQAPKKPKMTEEEMNLLFDQLLGKDVNEPKPAKSASAKTKADNKPVEKRKIIKSKTRKRARVHSESSGDEFNINKTTKKRTSKKNNADDSGINLEQELKECIGVASRKSQRKCTSGKQNVLIEYWSSDEEAFEAMLEKQKIIAKKEEDKTIPNSDLQKEISVVIDEPTVQDKPEEPPKSKSTQKRKSKTFKKPKPPKKIQKEPSSMTSNRRKRAAANPLYHWSSSSEDESQSLIEIKPIREEDDEEDRPIQHGWIVGDSPKKLVTMLALIKGKKSDVDGVKEQGKKRTSSSVS